MRRSKIDAKLKFQGSSLKVERRLSNLDKTIENKIGTAIIQIGQEVKEAGMARNVSEKTEIVKELLLR